MVTVRDEGPTGKPRACNAGLVRATGEYLVIYDAEDRPDRDQLRKAVAAFAEAPAEVVCMQAKLNYFNRAHNLLTRWFAVEYSLWFDQLLPGLQSMDAAIPLGGTSNHFVTAKLRELEDGTLSTSQKTPTSVYVSMSMAGRRPSLIPRPTKRRQAATTIGYASGADGSRGTCRHIWFRCATRSPCTVKWGQKAFAMFQLFFGAPTSVSLVNPLYWLMTVVWFASHFQPIELLFPRLLLYISVVGFFVGNAAFTLSAVGATYIRGNYEDVKWALLSPFYWLLMSIGAWKGLIQLCYRPFYWEKTVHGFCLLVSEASIEESTDVSA